MKSLSSVFLADIDDACNSYAGWPAFPSTKSPDKGERALVRSSHRADGTMNDVDGVWLRHRDFTPPGAKTGLEWIEVSERR